MADTLVSVGACGIIRVFIPCNVLHATETTRQRTYVGEATLLHCARLHVCWASVYTFISLLGGCIIHVYTLILYHVGNREEGKVQSVCE